MNIDGYERAGAAMLSNGRQLTWYEWGPAEGRPVLFCTGAGMGGQLGFGAAILSQLGLRLIGIDRPGLGRSTHDPNKTLRTWRADVVELCAQRDLAQPLVVGFSQGAPFALALWEEASAIALVAGQDQLTHPALQPMLTPQVSELLDAIEADAEGFEQAIASSASAAWLHEFVLTTSSARDQQIYGSEPLATAYRESLEAGFSQGAAGYARDLVVAMGEWPFAPEQVSRQVSLWYGAEDASTVHSPDLGATLARRLPRGMRRVIDGAGSAILWTHAELILSELAQLG